MDSPGRRSSSLEIPVPAQVDAVVDSEKAERMQIVMKKLRAIFAKVREFYTTEKDEAEAAYEVDKLVSGLIYTLDTLYLSDLSEEERMQLDLLKSREINETSAYISTLVDLYSSIETRETNVALIDGGNERFGIQRRFLAEFLAAVDALQKDPSIDNLVKVKALIKIYERMKMPSSILQDSVIMHCEKLAGFCKDNVIACLGGNTEFQHRALRKIEQGAESLFKTLGSSAKA